MLTQSKLQGGDQHEAVYQVGVKAVLKQAAAWRRGSVAIENGTHSGWFSRALT